MNIQNILKTGFFILTAALAMTAPLKGQNPRPLLDQINLNYTPAARLLTLSDAEKILGSRAHLSDSSSAASYNSSRYNCTYTGVDKNPGSLYFLYQQFSLEVFAKRTYQVLRADNEPHGINPLQDIGDEAFSQGDGQNPYTVVVRKGSRVFLLKINQVAGKTSMKEFNAVARKIAFAL